MPMVKRAISVITSAYQIVPEVVWNGWLVILFNASSSIGDNTDCDMSSTMTVAKGNPITSAIAPNPMLCRKNAPKICVRLAPRLRKSAMVSCWRSTSKVVIRLMKKRINERMSKVKTPVGMRATAMRLRNASRMLGFPLNLSACPASSIWIRYGYCIVNSDDPPGSRYPYWLSITAWTPTKLSIKVSSPLMSSCDESRW